MLRGKRVAVVAGPVSQEDALYLRTVPRAQWSLTALREALTDSGVHCDHLDPTASDFITRIAGFDVAFLNVHGPYGEDGRIQGLLDFLSVPYTSSGVLASSVGMDKLVSKAVFAHLGIATPRSSQLLSPKSSFATADFPLPAMLKAVDGGSSVGLRLIERSDELAPALSEMAQRGFNRCFLEEFITGRALTISVIPSNEGLACLPPLEFVTDAAYYDESTKLGGDGAPAIQYRVPDDLPEHTLKEMTRGAEAVHEFLDCRGAIRVDYMVDADNIPYALEINTIPGLQRHSNLPVSCAEAGLSYHELVIRLLAEAVNRATPAPWTVS
jgi:D-alanine-D-alanine ligase